MSSVKGWLVVVIEILGLVLEAMVVLDAVVVVAVLVLVVVAVVYEESITEDNFKEEATTMKTTTNQSGIEIITEQTTHVESNEASGATTEEDTLDEDPVLERTTIKVDHEDLTTIEASPDHTTTTE
jgi:hypothetical protein